jgi:hypothetical protein
VFGDPGFSSKMFIAFESHKPQSALSGFELNVSQVFLYQKCFIVELIIGHRLAFDAEV